MLFDLYKVLFWLGIAVVAYAYLGYGLLLYVLIHVKRWWSGKITLPAPPIDTNQWPKVTFIVCAYNESDWISDKVLNTLAIVYPSQNIRFVFVTDGSGDDTPLRARLAFQSAHTQSGWDVMHQPERRGKIAAFHRALQVYQTWEGCLPEQHIIVSTDANTHLNPEAVERIVAHFYDPQIAAVAGEKRIKMGDKDAANSAGEGIYWKYESLLKKWDSELWSVVGAAGELFAFRASLYEPVPSDTIVEDFYMTMRMAQKGYRVAYEPAAYAVETSSATVAEEMKRKVRIAAGGLQAVVRLAPLLNVFRYKALSFQYISHRVLRWTLAPLFLPLVFGANIVLAAQENLFYQVILVVQIIFYTLALLGYFFERRQLKIKAFFIPYYFCLMNYAMYAGFFRLLRGQQSVLWEKSKRSL
jgi:poly-beta-1,6-N-acetyl-D-glucosamine synthase